MELSIIINEKVKPEELGGGEIFQSLTWDSLLPSINQLIRLRDDEILDGFIVNESGLKIKISRKRGRKK